VGRHIGIYWDDTIRLEVGVELQGAFTEQDGVVRSETPAGLLVSTTHFGPYVGLGAAHDAIRHWCETNQHRLAGPSWEIYGHWLPGWNDDPSKIRTDVFHLLASWTNLIHLNRFQSLSDGIAAGHVISPIHASIALTIKKRSSRKSLCCSGERRLSVSVSEVALDPQTVATTASRCVSTTRQRSAGNG
jgi:hypothetical protein